VALNTDTKRTGRPEASGGRNEFSLAGSRSSSSMTPQLGRLGLISVVFFTVCGGAYGLEPLVGSLNPGWAVALILLVPLLWCLPITWMVSELSSALPEEGGYYVWVRKGLGEYWGFQEGWWTLCYTAVDMAIYPVLFVDYLAFFFPSLSLSTNATARGHVFLARWLVAVLVIATAFLINWRGIRVVGRSSSLTMALVLAPFLLLTVLGFWHAGAISAAFAAVRQGLAHGHSGHLLALGLATVLWNYSGWDNVSTFAGEVKQAQRSYPFALGASQFLITAAYVLPVLAGVALTTSPALWSESKGWPDIARLIAGPWFALLIAGMALVSAWSMFNSQLLYISRLPYAMAREGWFPSGFARTSPSTGVPVAGLAAACGVACLVSAFSFTELVVLDILLYSVELIPEFIALIALRVKKPEMERPFRVPGGWAGLVVITILPIAFAVVIAVATLNGRGAQLYQMAVIPAVIVTGTLIYFKRRQAVAARRPRQPNEDMPLNALEESGHD
jgi:amino acid transporter